MFSKHCSLKTQGVTQINGGLLCLTPKMICALLAVQSSFTALLLNSTYNEF